MVMTKWEYLVVLWTAETQLSEMNEVGQEGWELVNSVVYHNDIMFIFKRPTPSAVDMQFSMALKSDDPMAVANLSAHDRGAAT
jgi:hypothetical protein